MSHHQAASQFRAAVRGYPACAYREYVEGLCDE